MIPRRTDKMWSYSYTWRYWGRGWPDPVVTVLPDGGLWRQSKPGMKLLSFSGSVNAASKYYDLYLEDGSMAHMDWWTDPPDDYRSYPDRLHHALYTCSIRMGDKRSSPYEEVTIPPYYDAHFIRLTRVTDPSGRYIKITYGLGNSTGSFDYPTLVEGQ